jgi:hypothetical protein
MISLNAVAGSIIDHTETKVKKVLGCFFGRHASGRIA